MKSWNELKHEEKMQIILCNKLTQSTNIEDIKKSIEIENWLEKRGLYSLDYDISKKELKDVLFWHEKAEKGVYPC